MDDAPMRCLDLWYKINGETGRAFIKNEVPENDDKAVKNTLKAIKAGYLANLEKNLLKLPELVFNDGSNYEPKTEYFHDSD